MSRALRHRRDLPPALTIDQGRRWAPSSTTPRSDKASSAATHWHIYRYRWCTWIGCTGWFSTTRCPPTRRGPRRPAGCCGHDTPETADLCPASTVTRDMLEPEATQLAAAVDSFAGPAVLRRQPDLCSPAAGDVVGWERRRPGSNARRPLSQPDRSAGRVPRTELRPCARREAADLLPFREFASR
jgi:hypothetical protein